LGLGFGIPVGAGVRECQYEFEHPELFHGKMIMRSNILVDEAPSPTKILEAHAASKKE